ncbi:hypothetical protein BSL78_00516 [Apostichopus japonicus]|uniref:Reverse transcriptase domain-containing protein n=1 Tax=Stichopus japonicus TaxID=307972 RepID=A0A2G8LQQ5_STIJA|nr:hypothetical protein BSL78_00516 [Apostichopus japonicus]
MTIQEADNSFACKAKTYLDKFILENAKRPLSSNVNRTQSMAIKKLRNNPDVVIRQADKGGATTILNTTDYIFEAEKQLSNSDFYKILPEDPSRLFQPKIDELCQSVPQHVATKIAELTPKDPSLGTFYTLPKVHKLPKLITEAQQALPGVTPSDPENIRRSDICKLARKLKLFPPCRPIISGIGTLTEHLSGYMDSVLNPLLTHIPSYIQDTTHFLRILNTIQALPINSLLVTMDVSSLYTNIPQMRELSLVKIFFVSMPPTPL